MRSLLENPEDIVTTKLMTPANKIPVMWIPSLELAGGDKQGAELIFRTAKFIDVGMDASEAFLRAAEELNMHTDEMSARRSEIASLITSTYGVKVERTMTEGRELDVKGLKAGDVVLAGSSEDAINNDLDRVKFLGFSDLSTKYSEKPVYKTYDALLKSQGVRTNRELEKIQDEHPGGYGHMFNLILQSVSDKDVWVSYLYKGRWSVGSGADPLLIKAIGL